MQAIPHSQNQTAPSKWIPLLVYHKIHSEREFSGQPRYAISARQFDMQMQYLYKHGYRCLNLGSFLQARDNVVPVSGKAFVLTFDDGYENFLTNAFPVLVRYQFTATVFLAPNLVGSQRLEEGDNDSPLLTWDQIITLKKAGITFGSHTCNHPRLLTLSQEEIWSELTASKEKLEARLGEPVQYLAYPYGESNDEIRRMAQDAGYEAACGVITGRSGKYNLWRISYGWQDSLRTFAFRLTPRYNRLLLLRRWASEDTLLGNAVRAFKRRRH